MQEADLSESVVLAASHQLFEEKQCIPVQVIFVVLAITHDACNTGFRASYRENLEDAFSKQKS